MVRFYMFISWLDMEILQCRIRAFCWFTQWIHEQNFDKINAYLDKKFREDTRN